MRFKSKTDEIGAKHLEEVAPTQGPCETPIPLRLNLAEADASEGCNADSEHHEGEFSGPSKGARLKEKQEGRKDKERVQPKILRSSILSNGGDALNDVPANSNAGKKSRKRNGVVIKTNISRRLKEPAIYNIFMVPALGNARRRKLYWTPQEEDKLKEGVWKFSTTIRKNLPWRKILEFGQHVFDVTRTPEDLKDKWKNMMAKEKNPQEVMGGRYSPKVQLKKEKLMF
ncbi:hypothetical protein SLEP1_g47422 [Rubroshorea leprosula]|uniref:Myb-like domain-containing protein n=1 Tax=Rubroshorea leprosula TaxID=152421 RepID=A0AAV5LSL4_9ROSI|nr:hypothetical protein SLEP1_g47422 [Rubroshorea leprosula]